MESIMKDFLSILNNYLKLYSYIVNLLIEMRVPMNNCPEEQEN